MKPSASLYFAGGASLLAIAGVVAGMLAIGSPQKARLRRLDLERVSDLEQLSMGVNTYATNHKALPSGLADLAQSNAPLPQAPTRDPQTGAPYEYFRTGADSFRLCARFALATESDAAAGWRHGPGRVCFDLNTDKDQSSAAVAMAPVSLGKK